MAHFTREGADNRYVVLYHGPLTVRFDTYYGGAPLSWKAPLSGVPKEIIWEHAGAGFQNTIEEGQDLTQASANGFTTHRIARTTDSVPDLLIRNYYIREVVTAGFPAGATSYKVVGFYPDFWLSHQAPDDALPPRDNHSPQQGWILRWLYPPSGILPTPYDSLNALNVGGAAIWFQPTSEQNVGIIMEGNEVPPISWAWNQRLRKIPDGRVAFKTRISLAHASADAWAGVMFRRTINESASTLTLSDAYQSLGYFLNVNRSGTIELRYSDGTLLWGITNDPVVSTHVNSDLGCRIEVRTRNNDLDRIEIWVQDVNRTPADQNNPLGGYLIQADKRHYGPHFGLVGYSQQNPDTGGPKWYVQFSDREVFNVGTVASFECTPDTDGSVITDLIVGADQFVTATRLLYRVNTVSFLNPPPPPPPYPNYIWTYDPQKNQIDPSANQLGSYARAILNSTTPATPPAFSMYAGDVSGTCGMYCVPGIVSVTGGHPPSAGEHCLLQTADRSASGTAILHLNALPPRQDPDTAPPWDVGAVRLVAKWWPANQ